MKRGYDKFLDAVLYGNVEEVAARLLKQPDFLTERDEFGFTALHVVMTEEQPEVVQFLIERGADVHARNDEGVTPLHLAQSGEVVRILVENGADLDIRDHEGRTPLHVAAMEGEDTGAYEVMKALLELGANPRLQDKHGRTPVDYAQQRREARKVKLLQKYLT